MKTLHMVTFTLMAVGALNWGLVALLQLNLVEMLFGGMPALVNLVYLLVGASAVYELAIHMGYCMYCSGKKK